MRLYRYLAERVRNLSQNTERHTNLSGLKTGQRGLSVPDKMVDAQQRQVATIETALIGVSHNHDLFSEPCHRFLPDGSVCGSYERRPLGNCAECRGPAGAQRRMRSAKRLPTLNATSKSICFMAASNATSSTYHGASSPSAIVKRFVSGSIPPSIFENGRRLLKNHVQANIAWRVRRCDG